MTRNVEAYLILLAANLALMPECPLSMRVVGLFAVLLSPGILTAPLLLKEERGGHAITFGIIIGFAWCLFLFAAGSLSGGAFGAAPWILLSNATSIFILFHQRSTQTVPTGVDWLLIMILVLAGILRFWNLGYSEFQGDETRALLFASGLTQGDSALFFLHKKGPVEFLFPYGVLESLGAIDEFSARLPFALAGLTLVAVVYSFCIKAFSKPVAVLAALFCSIEGFVLAFSRIVQYQSFLLLFAMAAFYSAFRARKALSPQPYLYLSPVFLGISLLCHYDAVIAAAGVLALLSPKRIRMYMGPALIVFALAASFYIPFYLSGNFSNTASYLGQRVDLSKFPVNNLPRYFNVFSFYNSIYFTVLVWLPILTLKWLFIPSLSLPSTRLRSLMACRSEPPRKWEEKTVSPERGSAVALRREGVWAAVTASPDVALAKSGAVTEGIGLLKSFNLIPSPPVLALGLWFLLGLICMGFLIARPNTHFYIIHPPLLILAALSITNMLYGRAGKYLVLIVCLLTFLSLHYPWFAFLKTWPEFRPAFPKSLPAIYPALGRTEAPGGAFFGFPHLSGWKGIGALYEQGILSGSYSSNEEELITAWYTHGARRDDKSPEYYFIAASPSDPVKLSMSRVKSTHSFIGRVYVENRKSLDIFAGTPVAKPIPYQLLDLVGELNPGRLPEKSESLKALGLTGLLKDK